MNFVKFIEKMKEIQTILLEFLDDELKSEEKFEHFTNLVMDKKIMDNKQEFKLLLRLITKIGNNYHRNHTFISKIEQLLKYFKTDIQNYFSNIEIFEIFRTNKRIILFLIEEKMIIIDEHVFLKIPIKRFHEYEYAKYIEYLLPEIKPLFTQEFIQKYCTKNEFLPKDEFIKIISKEIDEDFNEKRRKGENEDYLCDLIRLDKIKEFIIFVEQRNFLLDSEVKESVFETNNFLIENTNIKLVEYASFYGSINIIKYMIMKGVKLRSNIWYYAIHSKNAELFHYLEENHVPPPENDYNLILKESIKCHHNEISNYIIDNLIKEEDLQNNIENEYYNIYQFAFEDCNYCFFPDNMKYKNILFYLCQFDYYTLVKFYLEEENVDINAKIKTLIFCK